MISERTVFEAFPREPWPHQQRGVVEILKALGSIRSVCLSACTGSGKSNLQAALVKLCVDAGHGVMIYNARRGLTSQISRVFEEAGVHHGARAASMKHKQNLNALVQVGSIQTDCRRVLSGAWRPHNARYVIVDEAHMPEAKSEKAQQLYQKYLAQGARLIGMTGTPVALSHVYKGVIDLVSNSQMREIGGHVPCETFAIHQLDTGKIKPVKTGEFTEGAIRKEVWSPSIVGYALQDWERLNPERLPTLAACPGVPESVWVHDQWLKAGYKVAHIDAKECLINGERHKGSEVRDQVLEEARQGKFHLVTNCSVLQAGIDCPIWSHLILLRPYGSIANLVQTYGRVIRAAPGKEKAVIQDHCGNFYRWGSANEDRDWPEYFHQSEKEVYEQEQEKRREKSEKGEDNIIACPHCGKVRNGGVRCPHCGKACNKPQRVIVQQDGTLTKVDEPFLKPKKKPVQKSVEQKTWEQLYWSAKKGRVEQSFSQLRARYKNKMGSYPPDGLPYMPKDRDYKQKVKDLSWADLT